MSASTIHLLSIGEWQNRAQVIVTWEHESLLCKIIAVWDQCFSENLLTRVMLMSDGPIVLLLLSGRGGMGWWYCPWRGHSGPRSPLL